MWTPLRKICAHHTPTSSHSSPVCAVRTVCLKGQLPSEHRAAGSAAVGRGLPAVATWAAGRSSGDGLEACSASCWRSREAQAHSCLSGLAPSGRVGGAGHLSDGAGPSFICVEVKVTQPEVTCGEGISTVTWCAAAPL